MMNRLKDKNIIIYGHGRYSKDFLYIFDELKISLYIDDEASEEAESYKVLGDMDKATYFVIICKYDEKNAIQNLIELGLQRNLNFASATTFFPSLDFPIYEISKQRNLYVWGTGNCAHIFGHKYLNFHPEIEIKGFIDSNEEKSGKTFFWRSVYPAKIALEDKNAFFVISTDDYYEEICDILKKKGLIEGKDYIHYSNLLENGNVSRFLRSTIYDAPKLDYVCRRPFEYAEINSAGRISPCPAIRGGVVHNQNTLFYNNFYDAWHSNLLKVLRLSAINGTYTFCDPVKCNYKRESPYRRLCLEELHAYFDHSSEYIEETAKKEYVSREHIFNEKNYEIKELDYPKTLQCSFDKTCNLHCPSCRERVVANGEKKQEQLEKFSQRLKKEVFPNVKVVDLAGGGELFASKIYKGLAFDQSVAENKECIEIHSNGTLLTKENFEKISDLYQCIKMVISMDGCEAKTMKKLRAGMNVKKWDENMRNLAVMREKGKISYLSFNFVVQKANYKEMPGFVKMCLGYNADEIKFSPLLNWGTQRPEEFKENSMIDDAGNAKPELLDVLKDDIFKRPEVKLFKWLSWGINNETYNN